MIAAYFRMAVRSLTAHRGTALINGVSLVVGIASALVIFSVIVFETSFDKFHSSHERIYRIVRVSGDDSSEFRTGVSYPVPRAISDEITGIEKVTPLEYIGGLDIDISDTKSGKVKKFREERGVASVEPSFFEVFDFKGTDFRWIEGNAATALSEPFTAVLTEKLSRKYFGDENPVGKTIRLQKQLDCRITGVVSDLPHNTDFPFNMLISYKTLELIAAERMNDWYSVNDTHQVFVTLKDGSEKAEIENQIATVHASKTSPDLHKNRHYLLQELSEVHYDGRFGNFNGRTVSHQTLTALILIALFILGAGSINYINLSTAQSVVRAREIGIRKVAGSSRSSLVLQLLTETFLLVLAAGLIALILSEYVLINFQSLLNMSGREFNLPDGYKLLFLPFIVLSITILAGLYPSVKASAFNPISAIQSKFLNESIGGLSMRKSLVVLQFTITQILIVSTFILIRQMDYFRSTDMGFNREAIVNIPVPDLDPSRLKVFEDQVREKTFTEDFSLSNTLPSGANRNQNYRDIGTKSMERKDFQVYEHQSVDPSYLNVYGIQLVAGRNLTLADTSGNILINEKLVKNLMLGTPAEATGKEILMGEKPVTVAGVVKDFYSHSLKADVGNLAMVVEPRSYSQMSIKLTSGREQRSISGAVADIETLWKELFPEYIFSYSFFDENVSRFYEQEQKYSKLFMTFSLVFLTIGCLGLYGLITFVINRKQKEVAIRKVLGASLSSILYLFSKEYLQLILISFLIATPVTYYYSNVWLSSFRNHIDLQWWHFVVPAGLVLAAAFLIISGKSLRSASANPAEKLKSD